VTRGATVAFAALLLALCLLGIGRDLWTPDEPREAAISREMLLSPGVLPTLDGMPFVEKPPLYYWTIAGVFALTGGPSAPAARAVSVVASFLTLWLVFLWGKREFSPGVGAAAALGLASSAQFAVSSHWVLIDPLLMLFTTAALWAASRVARGEASRGLLVVFHVMVILALWTKGLIGPVLVAAGLVAYAAATRSMQPIARLHPVLGVAMVLAATFAFTTLLGAESGPTAMREWFWVNQVQRFTSPTDDTGHAEPLYYYLYTLPFAVFPWWVPFAAAFRPHTWRAQGPRGGATRDSKIFLGAVSLGMALVLSAAGTKRGTYLMPMLPPLFLLLAAIAAEWWERRPAGPIRGWAWNSQWALLAAFTVVPVAGCLAYLRSANALGVAFLLAATAAVVAAAFYARTAARSHTLRALAACAIGAVVGLLGVAAHLGAPLKDMSPFVARVGEQMPADRPIYVLGDFDETIRGIVPFVTNRMAVSIASSDLETARPGFVLVQQAEGGRGVRAPDPPAGYRLVDEHRVGYRYLALWQRLPDPPLSQAKAPVRSGA
jgi:4-amino-4-deoxy-L-arabinose transferase-like glycosyltransferase